MDAAERDPHELPPERARDGLPQRCLADTGRSHQREDRAGAAAARLHQTALGPELPDREVLEDPILDVAQALMVRIEHRSSFRDVEVVLRLGGPRNVEEPVEVGADPSVFGRLLRRALEPAELPLGLRAHVVWHPRVRDPGPILLDDILCPVLAELLPDRGHLLSQQHLPLALLEAARDLVADPFLDLDLREGLLRPLEDLLEPCLDVEGLEDLHLLLEGKVGRVPGGIRQLSRIGHAAKELGDRGDPASVGDGLDRSAVLLAELPGSIAHGLFGRLDLDPRRLSGAGDPEADGRPPEPADDDGFHAVPHPPDVLDLGHDPDACVPALHPGHGQQFRIVALGRGADRRPSLI